MNKNPLTTYELFSVLGGYLVMVIGILIGTVSNIFEALILGSVVLTSSWCMWKLKKRIKLQHFLFPLQSYSCFQIATLLYEVNKGYVLLSNILIFGILCCASALHYIYQNSK